MRDRPQFSRLDRVHTMNVVSQYQQVMRLWSPPSDVKGILSKSRTVLRQVYVAVGCSRVLTRSYILQTAHLWANTGVV